MLKQFLTRKLKRTPLWLLLRSREKISRMHIIQRCIDVLRANTYLEIGVSHGECFASIQAPNKIGVDPIAPAPLVVQELGRPGVCYFRGTSDSFFEAAAPEALINGVDVVFIDGLHTFAQAYRDCVHAVRFLNPGGIILFHDCLPESVVQGTPAGSYEEVRTRLKESGVAWDGMWTGDVWKAVVALRRHPDLETLVLDCDCGIGLVQRRTGGTRLKFSDTDIEAMKFADLAASTKNLLGLRRPAYLERILASRRR